MLFLPLLSGSSNWLMPSSAGCVAPCWCCWCWRGLVVECRGGVVGLVVSRVLPLCSSVCVLVDGGVPSSSWLRSADRFRIPNFQGPFSAPAAAELSTHVEERGARRGACESFGTWPESYVIHRTQLR